MCVWLLRLLFAASWREVVALLVRPTALQLSKRQARPRMRGHWDVRLEALVLRVLFLWPSLVTPHRAFRGRVVARVRAGVTGKKAEQGAREVKSAAAAPSITMSFALVGST